MFMPAYQVSSQGPKRLVNQPFKGQDNSDFQAPLPGGDLKRGSGVHLTEDKQQHEERGEQGLSG